MPECYETLLLLQQNHAFNNVRKDKLTKTRTILNTINGGIYMVILNKEILWQMADKLRNNMDASEYKHVALGLIFLSIASSRILSCMLLVIIR